MKYFPESVPSTLKNTPDSVELESNPEQHLADVLHKVTIKGSPDLSLVTDKEKQMILDWYWTSEVPEQNKAAFLEEFMMHGLINDTKAHLCVSKMSDEQKNQVGKYIFKMIKPQEYVQTFYECYPEMDYESKVALRHEVQDNYELAILLAPFMDISKLSTTFTRGDHGMKSNISLLDYEFSHTDEATKLLETILSYTEKHVDVEEIATLNSGDPVRIARYRSQIMDDEFSRRRYFSREEKNNISYIIDDFFRNRPFLLYPYLKQLRDYGYFSDFNMKEILQPSRYIPTHATSREEEATIARLTKELKGAEIDDFWFDIATVAPQYKAFEIYRIRDAGIKRATHCTLKDFKEYSQEFTFDKNTFLSKLLESGYAVFSEIESLNLTKEEVRLLILRYTAENGLPFNLNGYGDLQTLLEWNNKIADGPDLEEAILPLLGELINSSRNGGRSTGRIEEIISWFRPENQRKIITSINRKSPEAWLNNLSFAVNAQVMPLDEIMLRSAERDGYQYLEQYNKLLFHVKELNKEGVETPNLGQIRTIAKTIFATNPNYFLSKGFKHITQELYSEEEQEQFIQNQLQKKPVDLYFFSSLLSSPDHKKYLTQCKEILRNDSQLFIQVVNEGYIDITEQFSVKESVSLLIPVMDSLLFKNGFMGFFDQLIKDKVQIKRFVDALIASNNTPGIIKAIDSLGAIERKAAERLPEWEKAMKTTGELLALRTNRFLQPKAVDVEAERKRVVELLLKRKVLRMNPPNAQKEKHVETVAKHFKKLLEQQLKHICEHEKFAVFNADTIELLGTDALDIINREIEEYVSLYPEILLTLVPYGMSKKLPGTNKLLFVRLLGEEIFSRLFESKIRSLALFTGKYGRSIDTSVLPEPLTHKVDKLNILSSIKPHHHLDKDFYLTCIDRIEHYEFLPLFISRLKKIADEEIKMYGVRKEPKSIETNEEFVALLKTLSLLEDSALAHKNKEEILGLSKEDQSKLLGILELLILNDLDTTIDFNLATEPFEQVEKRLLTHLLTFNKKVFDLESINSDKSEFLSAPALKALSIYYSKTCRENKPMNDVFKTTMSQVLSGQYDTWRTWGTQEIPLQSEKEESLRGLKGQNLLPETLTVQQYEMWSQEQATTLSETFTFDILDIHSGINDIFSLAVVDEHVSEDVMQCDESILIKDYEKLTTPIVDFSKRQQELRLKMQSAKNGRGESLSPLEEEEYEQLKQKIIDYKAEHEHDLKRLEALQYIKQLKKIDTKELEKKAIQFGKKSIPFSTVFSTLEDVFSGQPDFLSDLRRVRNLLQEGSNHILQHTTISRSELTITDRVNLETYVRIGEKPVSSCQHYDGTDLNYGLLSYLSDPAVKIVQIYNEQGTIIARAVLRLLEDGKGTPQLFMERIYSSNNHPKIKEAMLTFCTKKAEALNATLYTQESYWSLDEKDSNNDAITLYSKGSRSPYVYTDAGGGKVPNGIFKIEIV